MKMGPKWVYLWGNLMSMSSLYSKGTQCSTQSTDLIHIIKLLEVETLWQDVLQLNGR